MRRRMHEEEPRIVATDHRVDVRVRGCDGEDDGTNVPGIRRVRSVAPVSCPASSGNAAGRAGHVCASTPPHYLAGEANKDPDGDGRTLKRGFVRPQRHIHRGRRNGDVSRVSATMHPHGMRGLPGFEMQEVLDGHWLPSASQRKYCGTRDSKTQGHADGEPRARIIE